MTKLTAIACLSTLLLASTANAVYRMHCTGENPNIEAIVAIDGPKVSVDVIENGVMATPLNRPCTKISTGLLCVSVLGETRYEMYPTFVVSELLQVAIVKHEPDAISSHVLDNCQYMEEEEEQEEALN